MIPLGRDWLVRTRQHLTELLRSIPRPRWDRALSALSGHGPWPRILLAGAALAMISWYLLWGPARVASQQKVLFEVLPGQSSGVIARNLKEQGLIRSSLGFRLLVKMTGSATRLKAGEYELAPKQTAHSILGHLLSGRVKSYPFTIPEGYTARQIRDLLASRGYIDAERFDQLLREVPFTHDFLPAHNPPAAAKGFQPSRLEGFLFPATYSYVKGMSEERIIRMMLDSFAKLFTQEMRDRAAELNMSIHQVVTLASIIEREAMVDVERPIISSVFHNRLRLGWKLDSCATVNYILQKPNALLTTVDTQIDSPYNTYRYAGLPPGPIGNPGLKSIMAALYPAQTDFHYFVAKNDGTGVHDFSRTFEEHLRKQALYQGR